jgi:5'-phosphate synthase pdxT subunit
VGHDRYRVTRYQGTWSLGTTVFIRAPWVSEVGPRVEVLAQVDDHPVAVRCERVVAVAFHPELAGEPALHQALLDAAGS